jgi:ubiquinone/menaquinone biosynthesis C-methylase UbiE
MSSQGLLGDSADRDYSRKLSLFNTYAQPELLQAIASLQLRPGMRVVDVGCGTGEALGWLQAALEPDGCAIGLDLAAAHLKAARRQLPAGVLIAQAEAHKPPLRAAHFDLVWCVNTLNHLRQPMQAVEQWRSLLCQGGRIAVGQSSLLPEMFFAWDARLERIVNEAVRQYYRERYGVSERELTAVRALLGVLRQAGMRNVGSRTFMIERISPLRAADELYLTEAIFRDTWGERLRRYLDCEDFAELCRLCDPGDAAFALRRPDFHYLQSFTLVIGEL